MEVKILDVKGFEIAARAIRLAYNSKPQNITPKLHKSKFAGTEQLNHDDYNLMLKLLNNNDSHSKGLRMIQVWLEITAPRFWWAEFDTYKVGTVTCSESTVHTIQKKPLDASNFEKGLILAETLDALNKAIENQDDLVWVKSILPESFLQKRIVCTNYQTLKHMYYDRKTHPLPQWKIFLDFLDGLPYINLIKTDKEK